MRKISLIIPVLCMALCILASCNAERTASNIPTGLQSKASEVKSSKAVQRPSEETAGTLPGPEVGMSLEETESEETKKSMQMKNGDTEVSVDWEDNGSVEALQTLCQDAPLTIQLSMYGGFEQVGSIGQSVPRSDTPTTTQAGDIVLYSGNQIVVFYEPNSWAYTRLGHITDKSEQEMAELLGSGNVTITIGVQ